MFVTWDDKKPHSKQLALARAAKGYQLSQPVLRTKGTDIYRDQGGPGQNIRDGYDEQDYEEYRFENAIPKKPKHIIAECDKAYHRVGIVRNIIDLMADFATQGIDLYHPNEQIQNFYREWFRRVGGKERSERFVNYLCRRGNVIVTRRTARLRATTEKEMRQAKGSKGPKPDTELPKQQPPLKRVIPQGYRFNNVLPINIVEEELSLFVGVDKFRFCIELPPSLMKSLKGQTDEYRKNLLDQLPNSVADAIQRGSNKIELDPDRVSAWYYKRDDWDAWAKPMTYSILPDLRLLQKMKLADLSALDGAISCIRVWKLGNIEHKILPTEAAINKLAEMLMNNVGGGVMDLVWGPELEMLETSTEVHRFLGSTKYEPVLTAIYAGLGVPPTLTGSPGQTGFTNNAVSLKTLCERLQYVREILTAFWNEEIRLVQKAMSFKVPAQVTFDRMTLTDEVAEKTLLLSLWDRGLVSDEIVQERFGEIPDIEEARIRRDEIKRKSGRKPPKASPYHDPQTEEKYKNTLLNQGTVTPSQILSDPLPDRKPGEKTMMEMNQENSDKLAKQKTDKQQTNKDKTKVGDPGRPRLSKDKKKRKQKVVKPRTKAANEFLTVQSWAENAQAKIHQIASPGFLNVVGKRNCRELSEGESATFESYKFHVLANLEAFSDPTQDDLVRIGKADLTIPTQCMDLLSATISKHVTQYGKEPPIETLRRYQAGVIALWKTSSGVSQESDTNTDV